MAEIVAVLKNNKDAASVAEYRQDTDRQARLLPETGVVTGMCCTGIKAHYAADGAKSSPRTIVAAPTAGSCERCRAHLWGGGGAGLAGGCGGKAMPAAGMVGILIAEHSTFSGGNVRLPGGMRFRLGMAAAGMVQLLAVGKPLTPSPWRCKTSGLLCDPVAGRVRCPAWQEHNGGQQRAMMAEL